MADTNDFSFAYSSEEGSLSQRDVKIFLGDDTVGEVVPCSEVSDKYLVFGLNNIPLGFVDGFEEALDLIVDDVEEAFLTEFRNEQM
jgi:hypothetical protein